MNYFCAVVTILFTFSVQASGWEENPQVEALLKSAGVNSTFVLYDVQSRTTRGYNEARAQKRFVPASTFKIPNTLIGLWTGAVKSVDEVLPFTGPPQPFIQAWKKDMALRQAIALSNVPIYQELARRVGLERMREKVSALDYGNKEIGTSVDTFWLKGPLEITAVEQTRFLAGLAQGALPAPAYVQQSVREILWLDRGPDWELYGKTGWANAPDPGVGWWVGWVQKNGRVYTFALNMDMEKASDAPKREALGRSCLQALGII